ncbi:MAG: cyclase family protein [Candidatus Bipolaricaulis sp.]|nr:cyclase family protein [Candidatus Bipolaricaulis sp.]
MFEIIDLTRRLTKQTLQFPGERPGLVTVAADLGRPEARLTHVAHLDLHLGTHMDAPLHFIPGGADIASLALALRWAVVVRTREREIPPSVLPAHSLRDCAVLFDTGWAIEAESPAYFEGFPYLSPKTAAELVNRGAGLIGIDSPSADPVDSDLECPAHHALLGAGIPIVEGLCNLDRLPDGARRVWFAAFPLKLEDVEGSPVRAVALLPAPNEAQRRR